MTVMQRAGVPFATRDGRPREGTVEVDFRRLLRSDTLVNNPPTAISPTLSLLGWLDQRLDWVTRVLPFVPSPL